jgi:ectoine hydroxylase-related dioxygenase (phytanoyl-CoA dioxygenase family)
MIDVVSKPTPTCDLDRAEDDLRRDGYCIVTDVLSSDQVECLKRRVLDQASGERKHEIAYEFSEVNREAGTENFTVTSSANKGGPKHQFIGVLVNKGQVFRDLVLHPIADRLVGALLGDGWLLSAYDASIVRPGGPMQALHTDQWWMPRPQSRNCAQRPVSDVRRGEFYGEDDGLEDRLIAPVVSCTATWTLTEFCAENGATRVVPGSHLSGEQPDPSRDYDNDAVSVAAPLGALIMWDARTWHGMGNNRSDGERIALYTTYTAPMFRTQINFSLALLPETKEQASAELLARLGFKVWGGFYGRVGAADGELATTADIIPELT